MWTPLFKRMGFCFISKMSFSKKFHKQKHCVASRTTPSISFWFKASCVCDCVGNSSKGTVEGTVVLRKSSFQYSTRFCVRFLSILGVLVALHFGLDGALHVAKRERSGQFLYPIPDSAGRPVGNRLPGSQLPLLVDHRGPGQWCGWLTSFFDLWPADQTIPYLLSSLIALNGCLSDWACGIKTNFLKCQMIY